MGAKTTTGQQTDSRTPLRRAYDALPGNNAQVLRNAVEALTTAGKLNQMGNTYTVHSVYAVMDERTNNQEVAEALLDAIAAEKQRLADLRARAEQLAADTTT